MVRSVEGRFAVLCGVLGLWLASCGSEGGKNGLSPAGPDLGPAAVSKRATTDLVPLLLLPEPGAALANDCGAPTWAFDWEDVPGATQYEILVRGPHSPRAVVDRNDLTESSYTRDVSDVVVPSGDQQGWRWRVRAFVSGVWQNWSPEQTFNVEPLVPILKTPAVGAVLDNGCTSFSNPLTWAFGWSKCRNADQYQLYVKGKTARIPVINETSSRTQFHWSNKGFVADQNRLAWQWRVRALYNGVPQPWSEESEFDVEPMNTDCSN
jgi:hypothetical protein